jgi:hypothetical protein
VSGNGAAPDRVASAAELAAHLRALAEALPPGAAVPVPREWLLDLLEGAGHNDPDASSAGPDLTVAEVAAELQCPANRVREAITKRQLIGYRVPGVVGWRVTRRALDEAKRAGAPLVPVPPTGPSTPAERRAERVDVGAEAKRIAHARKRNGGV